MVINELQEQEICVSCGFCCDGTLFEFACLDPGERGHLPVLIEKTSSSGNGEDFFRLPCNYFSGKCIIYDSRRANVCSAYRCQLLKDFAEGRVKAGEAMEIVSDAKAIREGLTDSYLRVSGGSERTPFRRILLETGKRVRNDDGNYHSDDGYELLMAGCNIFEALLIKHFRAYSEFEKMMAEK